MDKKKIKYWSVRSTHSTTKKFYTETLPNNYIFILSAFVFSFTCFCVLYAQVYHSEFGINYFHHANLSDVYQVFFSQITFFQIVLIVGAVFHSIVSLFILIDMLGMFERILHKLINVLIYLSMLIIPIALFYLVSWLNSSLVIKGVTPRYDIHLKDKSTYRCLSIISAAKSNTFYWDYKMDTFYVIPNSNISFVKQVIGIDLNKNTQEARELKLKKLCDI
jgi:hypothetical protein